MPFIMDLGQENGEQVREPAPWLEVVEIPRSIFLMGSSDEDVDAFDDERPQRRVYLDWYMCLKFPVTKKQFHHFMEETGYVGHGDLFLNDWIKGPGDKPAEPPKDKLDHPVTYVSWYDAKAFSDAYGLFLLSEAQWEKAARGEDGRRYPWGDTPPDSENPECNHAGKFGGTTPVNMFDGTHEGASDGRSPYGVYDMAGNVWEWCSNRWIANLLEIMQDDPETGCVMNPMEGVDVEDPPYIDPCARSGRFLTSWEEQLTGTPPSDQSLTVQSPGTEEPDPLGHSAVATQAGPTQDSAPRSTAGVSEMRASSTSQLQPSSSDASPGADRFALEEGAPSHSTRDFIGESPNTASSSGSTLPATDSQEELEDSPLAHMPLREQPSIIQGQTPGISSTAKSGSTSDAHHPSPYEGSCISAPTLVTTPQHPRQTPACVQVDEQLTALGVPREFLEGQSYDPFTTTLRVVEEQTVRNPFGLSNPPFTTSPSSKETEGEYYGDSATSPAESTGDSGTDGCQTPSPAAVDSDQVRECPFEQPGQTSGPLRTVQSATSDIEQERPSQARDNTFTSKQPTTWVEGNEEEHNPFVLSGVGGPSGSVAEPTTRTSNRTDSMDAESEAEARDTTDTSFLEQLIDQPAVMFKIRRKLRTGGIARALLDPSYFSLTTRGFTDIVRVTARCETNNKHNGNYDGFHMGG